MVNKPIKKWSSGNFEVAIWLNQKDKNGDKVEFKTASLSRSWKKKDDDTWRNDVVNLRRVDIPKAILLLQKAQEELYLNDKEEE
ncbi:MAG: hypothetical protein PHT54_03635 [Candidatus Nanoarchaeia archaeon]|nr:hypothetical protein [Candidatus Nanoarchaeia archaeon]